MLAQDIDKLEAYPTFVERYWALTSGWFWKTNYTKNGHEVTHDKEVYYPDVASDFAVDFFKRHREHPFYFYLSDHTIHGPILRTPDSKAGASPSQLYNDNVAYLDKTVGKIVKALDELGLREKTLILFSTDNGTSRMGYTQEHDPKKDVGMLHGKRMNGMKGTLLEGGSRVPIIANWKGTLPTGGVRADLIDFTDLLPTFAELAEAQMPGNVKFDGRSFAPQLRGEKGSPREWIFVQLGAGWYARSDGWKLNEKGELFSMINAPNDEKLVAADSSDPGAKVGRQYMENVLAELNPGSGNTPPVKDAANRVKRKQNKKKAKAK